MSHFDNLQKSTHDFTGKRINSAREVGNTSGYDGHSLRAFFYFGDQMPDIDTSVKSINSISAKYKGARQESKAPTFALTR